MDVYAVRIYNDTDVDILALILKWKVTAKDGSGYKGTGLIEPLSIRYNDDTPGCMPIPIWCLATAD
jgi:hypothetical protein